MHLLSSVVSGAAARARLGRAIPALRFASRRGLARLLRRESPETLRHPCKAELSADDDAWKATALVWGVPWRPAGCLVGRALCDAISYRDPFPPAARQEGSGGQQCGVSESAS